MSTIQARIVKQKITKHRQPEQTIKFTRLDDRVYCRTAQDGAAVDQFQGRVAAIAANDISEKIVFDTFNTLHRHSPASSGMGSPLAEEVVKRVKDSPEFTSLREATRGDPTASFLGAMGIAEKCLEALDADTKEAAKKEAETRREAEDAEVYASVVADDASASPEKQDEAKEAANDARAAHARAMVALKQQIQGQGAELAAITSEAVAKEAETANAQKQLVCGLLPGCGVVENPSSMIPPEEKFRIAKIAQQQGKRFQQIAESIGRMTREANTRQQAKTNHDSGTIVDVGLGSDLSNMLEDEVASLLHPQLKVITLSKIATDSAMVYEVEEKQEVGRGPIVMFIDESGSMSGTKEAESKGIAIALAHVAAHQRRRFVCHFFQSVITLTVTIEPGDAFRSGPDGKNLALSAMCTIAERGTAGGTNFDPVLVQAIASLSSPEMSKADVLMLTDGQADASDANIASLNAIRIGRGTRWYTMLVGNEAARSRDSVAKFSDQIWTAESLFGAASQLFGIV